MILGGGPAGLAAGRRIVKGGGMAVVVERTRYEQIRVGEHLPPEGVGLLRRAGFDEVGDDHHLRSAGVKAWWGGDTPNYMDYLFHPVGHGLNLSRPRFDQSLAEQCRNAGVRVLTGARLIESSSTARGWRVAVHCDERIRRYEPELVVDATGRTAAFARLQGSSIQARDAQVGLIVFCASRTGVDPSGGRVVIESVEDGWWYFSPLRSGRAVCMFMTDADLMGATPGSALARWKGRLHRTLQVRSQVEAYPVLTKAIVRSARSQRLDRMSGRAWVAVGDAAAVFDPLSSHGIARGVEHGWQAADAALAYLGGDRGALERLSDRFAAEFADYERLRAGYYALEDRWPRAPFWRRRQPGSLAV